MTIAAIFSSPGAGVIVSLPPSPAHHTPEGRVFVSARRLRLPDSLGGEEWCEGGGGGAGDGAEGGVSQLLPGAAGVGGGVEELCGGAS